MKTIVLLTILISISLMSCKKTKVYTIQTNNIRHTTIAPFANASYTIYYKKREGYKPIYEGELNNQGNDVFDIKVNPNKRYYYSIKENNQKFSYIDEENHYLIGNTVNIREFNINNNTININYLPMSNMILRINNDSCYDVNDYIEIELVYLLAGLNLKKSAYIDNKKIYFSGCAQNKRIDYDLFEGRYAINWKVNRSYMTTEYTDTVSLIYGDTLHYTLNY